MGEDYPDFHQPTQIEYPLSAEDDININIQAQGKGVDSTSVFLGRKGLNKSKHDRVLGVADGWEGQVADWFVPAGKRWWLITLSIGAEAEGPIRLNLYNATTSTDFIWATLYCGGAVPFIGAPLIGEDGDNVEVYSANFTGVATDIETTLTYTEETI